MSIPQSGGGPIEDFAQLAELLASGCKPKADWRIGTEHEKFGWLTDTRKPLPYDGERSINALFAGLAAKFGWEPVREGENVIGLTRNGANISLEPGGQFELSGAAVETIHETAAELQRQQDKLVALCRAAGVRLVGPNSLGLLNVGTRYFATFSTALNGLQPKAGPIALATEPPV